MGMRQYANGRAGYNVSKDVGLYVISSDDMLIENVNSVLKRRGIIGVTDAAGSTRYYLDGRRGLDKTSSDIENAVVSFTNQNGEILEMDRKLYDAAAHKVFMSYEIDMTYIGSAILYSSVREVLERGFQVPINLKEMWANQAEEYMMSYGQMVRNIRYALAHSKLSELRTKMAVRYLALQVHQALIELTHE